MIDGKKRGIGGSLDISEAHSPLHAKARNIRHPLFCTAIRLEESIGEPVEAGVVDRYTQTWSEDKH